MTSHTNLISPDAYIAIAEEAMKFVPTKILYYDSTSNENVERLINSAIRNDWFVFVKYDFAASYGKCTDFFWERMRREFTLAQIVKHTNMRPIDILNRLNNHDTTVGERIAIHSLSNSYKGSMVCQGGYWWYSFGCQKMSKATVMGRLTTNETHFDAIRPACFRLLAMAEKEAQRMVELELKAELW